ncbi:MAG: DUF4350 domain-containing protein [Candidatus Kariarchaeaceae archaeon]|jgi:hypothetical protein
MNNRQIQAWLILIIVFAAILTFSAIPYTPKHSIYNESWNGASKMRNALETMNVSTSRFLVSPLILKANRDVKLVVVIGSERSYTQAEKDAYFDFVVDGGTLILFEDFGPGKELVEKMGITFFKGTLKERNPYYYINRPSQLLVQDIFMSYLLSLVIPDFTLAPLIVSEATGVFDLSGIARGETIPLVVTYPELPPFYGQSFIDTNDNNILDEPDIRNEIGIPLALWKRYPSKNGSVIVIGDSSIPLNQYWGLDIALNAPELDEIEIFPVANAFWTLTTILLMMQYSGAQSVVFDESHQAIAISSAAGIFNLVAGTWVGLINTSIATLTILFAVFTFSFVRLRKNIRGRFRLRRRAQIKGIRSDDQFISHPSMAERSISEQYILYQVMGDNFLHVANAHLISKLKMIGKADTFLKTMEKQYGDLSNPNSLETLLEIHEKLRIHVDEQKSKWI